MSKTFVEDIPVSPFCQYALGADTSARRASAIIAMILIACAWYFFSTWIAILSSIGVALFLRSVLFELKHRKQTWLDINKKDHEVSMRLEDILRTFYHYSEQDIQRAGIVEGQFDSLWSPVYAQYFSGERNLFADLSVSGFMGGVFASSSELSGKILGKVTPASMSDLGVVLILQNEHEKSIRVIVPHRKVAEQMLTEGLLSFNSDAGKHYSTLTSLQLLRMSILLPAKACTTFLSASHVLDQIVAASGKSLTERSMVKVYGKEVSPGVVMATALEIDGQQGVFIPTGYIKEVTDKLSEFLGSYRGDVKMLLDGQGPFAPREA